MSAGNHIVALSNDEPVFDQLSDDELQQLITRVYNRSISGIDEATTLANARTFMHAVFTGYGSNFSQVAWGSPDYNKLAHLEKNVYQFSGAKNHHQLRELTQALREGDRILPFSEYKVKAMGILNQYQGSWLQTEYNAAIAGSQMAGKWVGYEKAAKQNGTASTLLTYRTMEDTRVRPEHAQLDGTTRPINDNFWKTYYPPNGWNCRCTVLRRNDTEETPAKDVPYPDIPKMFATNLAETGLVFPKGSAYFINIPQSVNKQIISLIPDHPKPTA